MLPYYYDEDDCLCDEPVTHVAQRIVGSGPLDTGGNAIVPYNQPQVDRSLQFGTPQPNYTQQLLEGIYRLLSANPAYYPWQVIPPDGKAFDYTGTIDLPVSGGGFGFSPGPETVVLTMQCPLGYDGIVLGISNNVFGPSFNPALPSLTWRIRNGVSIANSQFVDGYNEIDVEFGEVKFPRPTSGIFLSTGQTLLYTITNNDASYPTGPATQTTCCFRGFSWPSQRGRG